MPFAPFLIPVMAGVVAAATGWQLKASAAGPNTGGSTFTLGPINTTGADLIVVSSAGSFGSTLPIDSVSNTWHVILQGNVNIWYAWNALTSSAHTFTVNNDYYSAGAVLAYSGSLKTSAALDQSSTANANQPGSITPTTSGQLIVAVASLQTANPPYTINPGFTVEALEDYISGVNFGVVAGDLIQGAAAAVNPTFLPSASMQTTAIASFKHA